MAAHKGQINYDVRFNVDSTNLKAIKAELSDIQKMTVQDFSKQNIGMNFHEAQSQLINIKRDAADIQLALDKAFNTSLGSLNIEKFEAELKKANIDLAQVYTNFRSMGSVGIQAFQQLSASVLTSNLRLRETHKILDNISQTMFNTAKWGLASSVFNNMTSSIQQAWNYTKGLDTSLNDIMIVTTKSADEMDRFAKQANSAAQRLGASTRDYTDAALIYYQQGLDDVETAARAEVTVKAANVTGQSGDAVSEQLTAIWNGYKVAAEETEVYIDKVAKVAATTAADLNEMATAMSKVASAANSAGVDIDHLNGMLATVISVTREAPETVGTSFRTIFARLGDLSLGKTDEEGVDLGNVSGKLHQLGVEVLDQTGNMRDMQDIIEDVAAKWQDWTQAQRQAAAVAMAGKMQYSRLIALFDNWDMYTRAVNDSVGAMGELQHEQDIYMESTAAHLQQLSTAWQRVYDAAIDNGKANGIIDLLTGMTNGLANWVEAIGGGSQALLHLGSIATTVFSKQIATSINTTIKNFENARFNAKQLENQLATLEQIAIKSNAVKNENTGFLEGGDIGSTTRYNERKKMESYIGVLNEDQINQGNDLINIYADLKSQAEQIESERQSAVDIIRATFEQENKVEGKDTDFFNNILSPEKIDQFDELAMKTEEDIKGFARSFAELEEAQMEYEKAPSGTEEETEAFERLSSAIKQVQEDLEGLENRKDISGVSKNAVQKVNTKLKGLENLDRQDINSRDTKGKLAEAKKVSQDISNELTTDIDKVHNALDRQVNGTLDVTNSRIKEAEENLKEFHNQGNRVSTIDGFIKTTSAVMMLSSAFSDLTKVKDIWDNDDLSTGEKILQTIMSLTTAVSMLAMAMKDLKTANVGQTFSNITNSLGNKVLDTSVGQKAGEALGKVFSKNVATSAAEGTAALGEMGVAAEGAAASTAAIGTEAAGAGAATASAGVMGAAALGLIAVAAVAVGVAIYAIYMKATEAQREIDDLRDSAKRLGEEATKSQERIDSIEASFNSYESALDTLKRCVKGSEEWNKALLKVNQTVLDILEKYPELAKIDGIVKSGDNGSLELDADKYEAFINSRVQGILRLQQASVYTNALADKKQSQLDIKKEQESLNNLTVNKTVLGTNIRDLRDAQGNRLSYEQKMGQLEKLKGIDIKKLFNLGEKEYNAKVKSFTDKLVESGKISELSAKAINEGYEAQYKKVQKLGTESENCALQIQNAAKTIAEMDLGTDASNVERQVYASTYAKTYEKEQKKVKKEIEDGLSRFSRSDNEEYQKLLEEYNKATGQNLKGASGNSVRGNDGSNGIYWRDADDDSEGHLYERDDIINAIASSRAQQKAQSSKTGQEAQRINQALGSRLGISELTADTILSKDFKKSDVNEETYNKLKELVDKNNTDLENLIYNDASKGISVKLTDAWSKMGYDNAEDWLSNLRQALGDKWDEEAYVQTLKEKFKNAVNSAAAAASEEFDLDEEAFKGYAEYIAEISDTASDEGDKLADSLKEDGDAASIVTKSVMRMNQGVEKLADGMDDWNDVLKKSSKQSYEYWEALDGIKDGLADVLDVEKDAIDNEFIEDHLDDITKAAKGNEEAIDSLRDAYADQVVLNIADNITFDPNAKFINSKEALVTEINNLQSQISDIHVGALDPIDDAKFIKSCQNIINDTNMTVEDANAMFAALGFQAEYQEDSEKTTTTVPVYTTYERVNETPKDKKGEEVPGYRAKKSTFTVQTGTVDLPGSIATYSMGVTTNDGKNVKKPQIKKLTKKAGGSFNNYSSKNSGGGSPGGSGGGGSAKEPKTVDRLDDEADRYHKVNTQIEKVNNTIKKLQSQQDKFVGAALLDNLTKQWEQLNAQVQNYNEKLRIAQSEQAELRAKLAGAGVQFNADGTISNYMQAFQAQLNRVNGLISQYNGLSAEQQEQWDNAKTIDNAKEQFNKFKENMDRYDELVSDFIPGLQQDIQDAIDQQIEINIKKFNYEVEIKLDMSEAEREWNDWKKRVLDRVDEDDILGNTTARLQDFSSYYMNDGTGSIQVQTRHLSDLLDELDRMDKGLDNVYGDNRAQALEDLKNYYEQLMDDLEGVMDLQDEIHEAYMDMMDEAQEKFDKQLDTYELITDTVSHDMKLIQMIMGDEAYTQLNNYYKAQQNNYDKQVDFQRQQVQFWHDQMETLEKGSDEWEKATENWKDALKDWQSSIEDALENIRDKFENTINEIFQKLNDKVTDGLGLDYVSEQWDLIDKKSESYLDTINALQGINNIESKYLKSINDSQNTAAQKKLREAMNAELDTLRNRDRLTKADLERAEKRYQLVLAQIALEEAQQNKSQMRLRRDSQGNYTYQYAADDDAVREAQDNLGELYSDLYNFDKEQYTSTLDEIYEIYDEYQQKMAEAALINDPELRAERELLIQEYYGDLINGLVERNEIQKLNLHESAFQDLAYLYDTDLESFTNLTETEKDLIMEDLIPQWDSGVQHMVDVFAGEGGFEEVTKRALQEIAEATAEYDEDLHNLADTAGVAFDDVCYGIDETIEFTEALLDDNNDLIDSYDRQLDAVKKVIDEVDALVNKYNDARVAAERATEAAYKYWQEQQRQAAAKAASTSTTSAGASGSGPNAGSGGSSEAGSGNGNLEVGDVVTYKGGGYYTTSYGGSYGNRGPGGQVTVTIVKNDGRPYPIHVTSSNSAYGWLRKDQLSGYDTGGYTGDWEGDPTNGKLALLHQKELVLNADDTKNLLDTVAIMRNLANTLGANVLNRLAGVSASMTPQSMNNRDELEQNVHIEAQFPNVTNSKEIEDALNNLVNSASQRIYENNR